MSLLDEVAFEKAVPLDTADMPRRPELSLIIGGAGLDEVVDIAPVAAGIVENVSSEAVGAAVLEAASEQPGVRQKHTPYYLLPRQRLPNGRTVWSRPDGTWAE